MSLSRRLSSRIDTDFADPLACDGRNPTTSIASKTQMAPHIARPEDKSSTTESHRTNGASAADAPRNGHDLVPSDIDRILALEHSDPHTFLGVHRADGAMVVRAYRPNADAITIVLDDGARVAMMVRHEEGIFEAPIDRTDIISYRLEIHYPGRRELHDCRSLLVSAHHRRSRSASVGGEQARARIRQARRASARNSWDQRRRVRGVGAQCARGQRHW